MTMKIQLILLCMVGCHLGSIVAEICQNPGCSRNPCDYGGICKSSPGSNTYSCEFPPAAAQGNQCQELFLKNRGSPAFAPIATQSGTYNKEEYHNAYKAFDGNNQTITHTAQGVAEPWWQLNMLAQYRITGVTIVNRLDCCGSRLHDFEVRVGNQDISANNTCNKNKLCGHHAGADIDVGGSVNIDCPTPEPVGQYLTVQIVKKCNQCDPDCVQWGNFLSINEIHIYGEKVGTA